MNRASARAEGALRPSAPAQDPLLRTSDIAQYSLPYPAEAGNSAAVDEAPRRFQPRPTLSDEKIPTLQVSDLHNARMPERKRKDGARKQPSKVKLPTQAKLLVGREEAAELLSISVRSIDYLIATRRMSTRRIGTRVLIPMEDVRRFARLDHPERMAG